MSSTPWIARQRLRMWMSIHRSASASSGGFCATCCALDAIASPDALYAGVRGAVTSAKLPRAHGGESAE
jgi:hypothetical protein